MTNNMTNNIKPSLRNVVKWSDTQQMLQDF